MALSGRSGAVITALSRANLPSAGPAARIPRQLRGRVASKALLGSGSEPAERSGAPVPAAAWPAPGEVAAAVAPPPQQLQQRFRPNSILPLVSSAVESSAEMAMFESVAGRSAMVGFIAAVLLEGFSSQPTFGPLAPDALAALAAGALAAVAAAGALAAAAARPAPLPGAAGGGRGAPAAPRHPAGRGAAASAEGFRREGADGAGDAGTPRAWWWLGAAIHESVVTSLTATQGSASGVTQMRVDEVVDFVVDRCLTRSVHPVFDPLYEAVDAGSTVVRVVDSLLRAGDERPDLPQ